MAGIHREGEAEQDVEERACATEEDPERRSDEQHRERLASDRDGGERQLDRELCRAGDQPRSCADEQRVGQEAAAWQEREAKSRRLRVDGHFGSLRRRNGVGVPREVIACAISGDSRSFRLRLVGVVCPEAIGGGNERDAYG